MNNITLNPGLHSRLLLIISTNAQTRQNGKVASERTYSVRKESLLSCFKDLIQLGYRLQDPANLSEKHVSRLVEYWLFEKKLMPHFGLVTVDIKPVVFYFEQFNQAAQAA